MIRQSTWMIILAIAGLLLFVFIVMPQAVQLFFRIFGAGDLSFSQEDSVPPQVPVVTLPPEATKESSVVLEGFGEADSQVVVVVNGQEDGKIDVNQEGQFLYTLDLTEGDNAVSLYGVDKAENKSNNRDFTIVMDKTAPSLAFEDLDDGKQVTLRKNQNFLIRGETEAGSQLALNDRNVYVNNDGTFSTNYYLQEGDNSLKFVTTDKAGNQTMREVRINFKY